jgi:Fic family protein
MSSDRNSITEQKELISDPIEKAKREVDNGFHQYRLAVEIIQDYVGAPPRPFKLKSKFIMDLHHVALEGIHPLAGTFRNTPVTIENSYHVPPKSSEVPDEVSDLCSYINENWQSKTATHLAAYVLWKLNWIHPFADGNGRTSRALSYVVMSIKMNAILPGSPTIPDQIDADKSPYYSALEHADKHWTDDTVNVSALESMLEAMLADQLLKATQEATGGSRWGLGKDETP